MTASKILQLQNNFIILLKLKWIGHLPYGFEKKFIRFEVGGILVGTKLPANWIAGYNG